MKEITPIKNIRQVHPNICWAACLEMVATHFLKLTELNSIASGDPLQKKILEVYFKLNNDIKPNDETTILNKFCASIGYGYPLMKNSTINYYKSISESLFKITCKPQAIASTTIQFPDYTLIKNEIDANRPIIIGMKYPMADKKASQINNHAFVVVGYVNNNPSRSIKVFDPLPIWGSSVVCTTSLGKISIYIYAELKRVNENNGIQEVSFVTNFQKLASKNQASYSFLRNIIPTIKRYFGQFFEIEEIEEPTYYFNAKDIITGVQYIFKENLLDQTDHTSLHFTTNFIRLNTVGLDLFIENVNPENICLLLPVWSNSENGPAQSHEILVQEIDENRYSFKEGRYSLLGVRQSFMTTLPSFSNIEFKDSDDNWKIFEINHETPNYSVVQILPLNFIFIKFQQNEVDYYCSIFEISDLYLKPGTVHNYKVLRELLKPILDIYNQ